MGNVGIELGVYRNLLDVIVLLVIEGLTKKIWGAIRTSLSLKALATYYLALNIFEREYQFSCQSTCEIIFDRMQWYKFKNALNSNVICCNSIERYAI